MKRSFPFARLGSFVAILVVLFIGWKVLSSPAATSTPGASPAPSGSGGSGGGSGETAKKPVGLPVVLTRARHKDMDQTLFVTGSLKTDQDVRVGSRIPGRVIRVDVKEGDQVHRGELLVTLDDSEIRAQVSRAQSAARSSKEKLAQLAHARDYRITQMRKDLEKAKSGLAAAQARVTQAQTTARITEAETEAHVAAAQANVTAAQNRLKILRDGARKQELAQAEFAVAQAKAEMDNARNYYERRVRLYAQDAIAKEEVDEYETRKKVAEATYQTAIERQKLMVEGPRNEEIRVAEQELRAAEDAQREAEGQKSRQQVSKEEIRAAEAQLQQAQSTLDAAEAEQTQDTVVDDEIRAAQAALDQGRADVAFYNTQLRDTRIYAPVDGVISLRTVNPGESVTPASVLFDIVALQSIYLEAQVPEIEIAQVRQGMDADVTIDSIPNRKFAGTVREIIPVADPAVKAFRVRVAVLTRPGDPQLPAGGFSRATIHVGRRIQTLSVPKSAVKSETGERYVFVVENGKAKRTNIEVGLTDDTDVEVLKGLQPGDPIVAVASPALVDGTAVTVTH